MLTDRRLPHLGRFLSCFSFSKRHFHFLEMSKCVAVDGELTRLRNFQTDPYKPGVSVQEV